uniref:Chemosensory protein 7 n=1 Tax=Chouioia cunea TaxID=1570515 RepID=A0A6B9CJ83_9HYME|nr:chemosensory protein 7 [Chouioia cunea]
MKHTCAVVVLMLLLLLAIVASAQDVNILLQNKNLVSREIGCVLQRNPCDVIGKQIRGLLPEALNNGCGRCTPQQATNAKKLIAYMKKNYPNEWVMIAQMYGRAKAVY